VTTRFTGWRLLAKELAIRGGFGGSGDAGILVGRRRVRTAR